MSEKDRERLLHVDVAPWRRDWAERMRLVKFLSMTPTVP